jgi:hypothetical protein
MSEGQKVEEFPQSRWERFKTGVSAAKTNAHKRFTSCPDEIYEIVDEVVNEYRNKDIKDILTENDILMLAYDEKFNKIYDYPEYDEENHTENDKNTKRQQYRKRLPPAVSIQSKEKLVLYIFENINSEDKKNLFKKIYILFLLINSDVGEIEYERTGFNINMASSSQLVYHKIKKPTIFFKGMCNIYKQNFELKNSDVRTKVIEHTNEAVSIMDGANDMKVENSGQNNINNINGMNMRGDDDERGGAKRKSKKRSKKNRKTKRRRHTRR